MIDYNNKKGHLMTEKAPPPVLRSESMSAGNQRMVPVMSYHRKLLSIVRHAVSDTIPRLCKLECLMFNQVTTVYN